MTEADAALLIANDDEGGEAETPPAFDHFGDAVDVHELVDELAVAVFVSSLAGFTRHDELPSCWTLALGELSGFAFYRPLIAKF
jgi:hypothetical protein